MRIPLTNGLSESLDEVNQSRIRALLKECPEPANHWLIIHAAFPVALTSDLLYKIWVNFRTAEQNGSGETPLFTVAQVLQSAIFREVSRDLYEMYPPIRTALLSRLKQEQAWGQKRMIELARFLHAYIDHCREKVPSAAFAEAQRWIANTFLNPDLAAETLLQSIDEGVKKGWSATRINYYISWAKQMGFIQTEEGVLNKYNAENPLETALQFSEAVQTYRMGKTEEAFQHFKEIANLFDHSGTREGRSLQTHLPKAIWEKLGTLKKQKTEFDESREKELTSTNLKNRIITFSVEDLNHSFQVEVLNLHGQKVNSAVTDEYRCQINLEPGYYKIRIPEKNLITQIEIDDTSNYTQRIDINWMFNNKYVLVIGTGGSLTALEATISEHIGEFLGEKGYGLIAGSFEGVDRVVALSYIKNQVINKRNVEGCFIQVVMEGQKPIHSDNLTYLKRVNSDEEWSNVVLGYAFAMIIVGGIGYPYTLYKEALVSSLPIIPIPQTGKDAQKIFKELVKSEHNLLPLALLTAIDIDLYAESGIANIKSIFYKLLTSIKKEGGNTLKQRKGNMSVLLWRKQLEKLQNLIAQPSIITAVVGMPGVGKTSLAIELAKVCSGTSDIKVKDKILFNYVVYLSLGQYSLEKDLIRYLLDEIGRRTNYQKITLTEKLKEKVRLVDQLLQTERVLIILDDFEIINEAAIYVWVKSVKAPSKIVIVTQKKPSFPCNIYTLSGYSERFCIEYIQEETRIRNIHLGELGTEKNLKKICDVTGGNPVLMNLVIGSIAHGVLSLEELDQISGSLNRTFEELYISIWERLSVNAKKILSLFPLFKGPIYRDAVCLMSGLNSENFNNVITEIGDWNLLIFNIQEEFLSLHGTLLDFLKIEGNKHEMYEEDVLKVKFSEYYLNFVRETIVLDTPNEVYWNTLASHKMEYLENHWQSILQTLHWAEKHPTYKNTFLQLVVLLVHYMESRLYNYERISFVKRAITICDDLKEYYLKALLQIDALSWTYLEEGDLYNAENSIETGIRVIEEHLYEKDVSELRALASAYLARTKVEKNQPEYELALKLRNRALQYFGKPWIKCRILCAAGDLFYKQANYKQALYYYQDSKQEFLQYGGEGRDSIIDLRIGLAHLSIGNIREAEDAFKMVMDSAENFINKLYSEYGLALTDFEKNKERPERVREARDKIKAIEKEFLKRSSSNLYLSLINDFTSRLSFSEPIPDNILSLAKKYENLRISMPAGNQRTKYMSDIVNEMNSLASDILPFLPQLTNSSSPGERLAAIAALQIYPDIQYIDWLAQRVGDAETHFVGFRATLTLNTSVEELYFEHFDLLYSSVKTAIYKIEDSLLKDPNQIRELERAKDFLTKHSSEAITVHKYGYISYEDSVFKFVQAFKENLYVSRLSKRIQFWDRSLLVTNDLIQEAIDKNLQIATIYIPFIDSGFLSNLALVKEMNEMLARPNVLVFPIISKHCDYESVFPELAIRAVLILPGRDEVLESVARYPEAKNYIDIINSIDRNIM